MSYCVLIMAHSWLREAEIATLITKLDARATWELCDVVVRASCMASSVPPNCS